MSTTFEPATAGAPADAPPRTRAAERAPAAWAPLLRLAAFAGLAGFAAVHWATLVEAAPAGRISLVVLVAVAGGGVLILLGLPWTRERVTRLLGGRERAAGALIVALGLLAGLVTICLGLGAAGLPLRLLEPAHWGELADGLDRGLGGVQGVEWPYDNRDAWITRTVLMGAPLLLGIAATLTFFPVRRGASVLRAAGLVVLLLAYGLPVTEFDPGEPLLRGLLLLALVAAWLWLPRLRPREAAAGAAVVAVTGIIALPVAAALDGDGPWWDYRAWSWFGGGAPITFQWNHEYGPLDWPREGTTLLNIRSDRPHYWKAETLDGFDGFRWFRSPANDNGDVFSELPVQFGQREGRTWEPFEWNPRWDEEIQVTIRSLTSDLIVGAGTTYQIDGARALPSADGTARVIGEPLEEGDSYTAHSYAPDPTRRQMQASDVGYSGSLAQYTRIFLPNPGESATRGVGLAGDAARTRAILQRDTANVPLRGEPATGDPDAIRMIQESGYGGVYDLALQWTAEAETPYDVVKAIERELQGNYTYAERVPTRPLPLAGFLFDDRRGYCQQFSGAMALMLRMLGVPARVAAGFSPGSYNSDSGEYRVRDLDAHSWVEVYFTGIGWVPFDPTPTAAPAESQSAGFGATSAARADRVEGANPRAGVAAERSSDVAGGGAVAGSDDGLGLVAGLLGLLVLAVVGGVAAFIGIRVSRRRRLTREQLAEAQLAELRRALDRFQWDVPPDTTLLALEQRLRRLAGPASARYAAALRAHRYDPREPAAPDPAERRALRRELSTVSGLRGRLIGWLAIPPGGPRPV